MFTRRCRRAILVGLTVVGIAGSALAQDRTLSERAHGLDNNKNGVIDRDEARGPLQDNFDEMDCDRSGSLDGAEIRGFFSGQGCPAAPVRAALTAGPDRALSGRAQGLDSNGNGVIDRDEARGPLQDNFDEMDCDRSGSLDGAEIRGFFSGQGCQPAAGQAAKPAATTPRRASGGRPPRPVRVDEVVTETLSQTYPVLGRLVARRAGDVAARVSGAITEISVQIGDRVQKGDVIARLESDRLIAVRDKFRAGLSTRRAMLRRAQAEFSKKSQELQRMKNLRKSSVFSRARFEDLERDVESRKATLEERKSLVVEAEADLNRVSIDLRNARIRAPYDGVVSRIYTEVGAYVNTGGRVVALIDDSSIEVETEIPSARIGGLAPGMTIRFQLDDKSQQRAVVRAIVPEENLRTRTLPVRLTPRFNGLARSLAVNQSVTVMVPVGKIRQIVTIHKDAITRGNQGSRAYVTRDGKAFPRQVNIGEAVGGRYIVLSGVQTGDRVVINGNEGLPPGSPIRILSDLSPARDNRR